MAHQGITDRDYFAAKAMQGMCSRDALDPGQATPQQRARLAYIEADAMMAARDVVTNAAPATVDDATAKAIAKRVVELLAREQRLQMFR